MQQYLESVNKVFDEGVFKGDRTGTGTQSFFSHQERYDLREGFPIVTTKFVPIKKIMAELVWLLEGSTDNERLRELGATIWDEWAITEEDVQRESSTPLSDFERYTLYKLHLANVKEYTEEQISEETVRFQSIKSAEGHKIFDECGLPRNKTYAELGFKVGDLGPIYGKQWRNWTCPDGSHIDQIKEVIEILKTKPDSRRMLVSAWNPADLPDESKTPHENVLDGKASLGSCHTFFQFYSHKLSTKDKIRHIRSKTNLNGDHTEWTKEIADFSLAHSEEEDFKEQLEKFITDKTSYHERYVELMRKYPTIDNGELNPQQHVEINRNGVVFYVDKEYVTEAEALDDEYDCPDRYISCQLYIRSNDVFLGKPFNIASYALLTHMVAEVVGMVPKELIITTGDMHIYQNHREQLKLQLTREPYPLPKLRFKRKVTNLFDFKVDDIELVNYQHHPVIKGDVAV